MKVGDIVARRSYGYDVLFKIVAITAGDCPEAHLKGITKRLYATAELSDLSVMEKERLSEEERVNSELLRHFTTTLSRQQAITTEKSLRWRRVDREQSPRYGTVAHLDGDEEYCRQTQLFYKRASVDAICTFVPESEQESRVPIILNAYRPDILVLTGHDGKLKSGGQNTYHNSRFFALAVRKTRRIRPDKDDLLVVSGACQSHYELLLGAGANFASSPGRVLIDIYDPCIVACQLALLPIREYLDPEDAVRLTSMQERGMGGMESQGKMRMSYPAQEEV